MDGPERRARQRHLRLGNGAGNPEIRDLDAAVTRNQHIARLDVAVDDAAGMRGRKSTRDLRGDSGGLARRQRTGAAQDRGEILSVDELHDDERTAGILAVVVHGDDVRVVQRGDGLGFLPEPGHEIGVSAVFGAEHLDRDVTIQLLVVGPVDGRHPALADRPKDAVATPEDRSDVRQAAPLCSPRHEPRLDPSGSAAILLYDPARSGVRSRMRSGIRRVASLDRDMREPGGGRVRAGMVPAGASYRSRCRRYSRNSPPRSGRWSASSTDAFSQPIVVPES